MNEQIDLREHLLTKLSRLEMVDMTLQTNVINKCLYEMIKNKEFLSLDTLVEKCNRYYFVQDRARYGKIIAGRVLRHIGGDSRTAGVNEINNRLSSFGWRLLLSKTTCKAIFSDKDGCYELDLNSNMFDKEELEESKTEDISNADEIQCAHLCNRLPQAVNVKEGRATEDKATAHRRLVAIVRAIAEEKREDLEQLKKEYTGLARPDFIWHYLLQSFSTMGRASGWHGLIGKKNNYQRVTYNQLAALSPTDREAQTRRVCHEAGIRMPDKKADYILGCFDYVKQLGGLEAAKAKLLAQPGCEAKIAFLQSFPGIGPKYARNIMMDVYHEDFRDSIALDIRIKAITAALGLSFVSYTEEERFYLDVAHEADLNGWELDRLLFNFRPEVEARLGVSLEGQAGGSSARRPAVGSSPPEVGEVAAPNQSAAVDRRKTRLSLSRMLGGRGAAARCDRAGGGNIVTDAEILRIWKMPAIKKTYTEARVFSCVISAHENNSGEIDTRRAGAVMQVVWPQNAALGAVPSEIRGNTANQNNNRNRQADFKRLMRLVRGES